MIEICIKYVPILGLAILLNTLIGMFNNIAIRRFKFKWSIFLIGLGRAALFVICIFGLAFIVDSVNIINEEISPEILLQTGTIYYAGKVALALKDMILPNSKADQEARQPRVKQQKSKVTELESDE